VAVLPAVRTSTASAVAVLKRHGASSVGSRAVCRTRPWARLPALIFAGFALSSSARSFSLVFLYGLVSDRPGYSLACIITKTGLQSMTGSA
jgi:hypothetical protein